MGCPPARVPLQVCVVGGNQDRPAVPLEGEDVEQILRHQCVTHREQATDPLRLSARFGHRGMVGEQADGRGGEHPGSVPGPSGGVPDEAGRVGVQLGSEIFGEAAQRGRLR